MRPHLALQASIIAFIEASRVTSASKAAASPPSFASFLAICTVSPADFTSLSAQKTLAPSWTKRMTVARPLPCPAPTTIAILFSRRFIPNLLFSALKLAPHSLSTMRVAPLAQSCHGWDGGFGPFSLCSGTHERPFRQESPAPQSGRWPRDHDPRRARAQSEERRRRDPARPARGVHRPVRLGQVLARLRHDLCGGPAPLRGVPLRLCAPVPRNDAEAGRRPDRRPVARDLDRAEDHVEESAIDRRHRHRDLRLHASVVGARRRALFARDWAADREPDRQPDG